MEESGGAHLLAGGAVRRVASGWLWNTRAPRAWRALGVRRRMVSRGQWHERQPNARHIDGERDRSCRNERHIAGERHDHTKLL